MSASDELAFLDATAQAELIRRKQLTPLELVDAAIARIERLNPALNAVITPMFELARSSDITRCRTDRFGECRSS